jgi:hypothetical protein
VRNHTVVSTARSSTTPPFYTRRANSSTVIGSSSWPRLTLTPISQMEIELAHPPRSSAVERHYLLDLEPPHDRHVQRAPRRNTGRAKQNALGRLHVLHLDRMDYVDHAGECVEGGLDGFASVDGGVAVQDLLEHLGVRYQPPFVTDRALQQTLRVALVGMGSSDQVHGDVGVDQDHTAPV